MPRAAGCARPGSKRVRARLLPRRCMLQGSGDVNPTRLSALLARLARDEEPAFIRRAVRHRLTLIYTHNITRACTRSCSSIHIIRAACIHTACRHLAGYVT